MYDCCFEYLFGVVDDRCDMEFDEMDVVVWLKLEIVIQEYVDVNVVVFQVVCNVFLLLL